jgi:hypothetical protein
MTYTEVCGGGRSCTVEDGSYIVINHAIASCYENVIVGDDNNGIDVLSPANLRMVPLF